MSAPPFLCGRVRPHLCTMAPPGNKLYYKQKFMSSLVLKKILFPPRKHSLFPKLSPPSPGIFLQGADIETIE